MWICTKVFSESNCIRSHASGITLTLLKESEIFRSNSLNPGLAWWVFWNMDRAGSCHAVGNLRGRYVGNFTMPSLSDVQCCASQCAVPWHGTE